MDDGVLAIQRAANRAGPPQDEFDGSGGDGGGGGDDDDDDDNGYPCLQHTYSSSNAK